MTTGVYLLEGKTLGFGDEKCRKNTEDHEESEDLHDMVQPVVCSAFVSEWGEEGLRENSARFSGGGRDPVCSGTITGGECLAGYLSSHQHDRRGKSTYESG